MWINPFQELQEKLGEAWEWDKGQEIHLLLKKMLIR